MQTRRSRRTRGGGGGSTYNSSSDSDFVAGSVESEDDAFISEMEEESLGESLGDSGAEEEGYDDELEAAIRASLASAEAAGIVVDLTNEEIDVEEEEEEEYEEPVRPRRTRRRRRNVASSPVREQRTRRPRKKAKPSPPKEPEVEVFPRKFVRAEWANRHLSCPICCDVLQAPLRAPCGHVYCTGCIHTWLEQGSQTCPLDRKEVFPADVVPDHILSGIIDDEDVACPFYKLGCGWVGKAGVMDPHARTCKANPALLPDYLKTSTSTSTTSSSAAGSSGSVSTPTSRTGLAAVLDALDEEGEDGIPSPGVMPLRMRLHQSSAGSLLANMFGARDPPPSPPAL